MRKFELNILGCGAALPTMQHNPSSQVVNIGEKLFMIDCGEGTQLQFRKSKLRFSRLSQIFISHLHGDHCLGLIGLMSTLALLGRTGKLTIHSPQGLEELLRPQLDFFCHELSYEVEFKSFSTTSSEVIYEDRSVVVSTIPLKHRIACAGFLFKEQEADLHLNGELIKFYNIPIKELNSIKKGADFITEDGATIPNSRLTKPADKSRTYAYCSDTAYSEKIIPIINNVDLLYHEATFMDAEKARAKETGHSTSTEAATIAKKANVRKLILGHFSSRYTDNDALLKEAKELFTNTILANENLCEIL